MQVDKTLVACCIHFLLCLVSNATARECVFVVQGAKLREVTRESVTLSGTLNIDKGHRAKLSAYAAILIEPHVPADGEGVLLAIWKKIDAIPDVMDSGGYEHWTIHLPSLTIGRTYELPMTDFRSFFSTGASAWLWKGAGYYANAISGKIEVLEATSEFATVNVELSAKGTYAGQSFKGEMVGSVTRRLTAEIVDMAGAERHRRSCLETP